MIEEHSHIWREVNCLSDNLVADFEKNIDQASTNINVCHLRLEFIRIYSIEVFSILLHPARATKFIAFFHCARSRK